MKNLRSLTTFKFKLSHIPKCKVKPFRHVASADVKAENTSLVDKVSDSNSTVFTTVSFSAYATDKLTDLLFIWLDLCWNSSVLAWMPCTFTHALLSSVIKTTFSAQSPQYFSTYNIISVVQCVQTTQHNTWPLAKKWCRHNYIYCILHNFSQSRRLFLRSWSFDDELAISSTPGRFWPFFAAVKNLFRPKISSSSSFSNCTGPSRRPPLRSAPENSLSGTNLYQQHNFNYPLNTFWTA